MLSARSTTVETVSVLDDILHVRTSPCSGPCFSFCPATKTSFGPSNPHTADPYEAKMIGVRRSTMDGGGEGVFAKQHLTQGTVAAIFNGFKVLLTESIIGEIGEEERYDRLAYMIHMPQEEDFYLDIPPSQVDPLSS